MKKSLKRGDWLIRRTGVGGARRGGKLAPKKFVGIVKPGISDRCFAELITDQFCIATPARMRGCFRPHHA